MIDLSFLAFRMPGEADTAAALSDALRRSKRNKFHLDVVGIHGNRRSTSRKDDEVCLSLFLSKSCRQVWQERYGKKGVVLGS